MPSTPPATPGLLEYYETPAAFTREVAQDLQARVPALFRPPRGIQAPWCAPCVGRGAILDAWPQHNRILWETNDLDPRWEADFHEDAASPDLWQRLPSARSVVDNPPFSVATAILTNALNYATDAVVLHLRLSFFEVTRKDPRAELLRACPPRGLLFLPRFAFRRSPSTGKWTTDSVGTVWATWLQGPQYDYVEPWIAFAGETCVDALAAETPDYRQRIDSIADIPVPKEILQL